MPKPRRFLFSQRQAIEAAQAERDSMRLFNKEVPTPDERIRLRALIEAETERYLKSGGEITQLKTPTRAEALVRIKRAMINFK